MPDKLNPKLTLDIYRVKEIVNAFKRCGWTDADIEKVLRGDTLARLLPVIRGNAEIVVVKHFIDLDAEPFIPPGLKIAEHCKGGQFEWDPQKVALYLSKNQEGEKR